MKGSAARVLSIPVPPAPRGRLIDAKQIQAKIGGSEPPTLDWIRANVPGKKKLGPKCCRWLESDVDHFLYGEGTDAATSE